MTARGLWRPIRNALVLVVSFFVLFFILLTSVFVAGGLLEMHRMQAGDYPLADTAQVLVDGRTIRLDRYAIHPFLAEYKRVLTVRDADGGADIVSELFPDTGGAGRLVLCRTAGGDIVMSDRFGSYRLAGPRDPVPSGTAIDLHEGVSLDAAPPIDMHRSCTTRLGAFDRDADGNYGFKRRP